MTIKVYIDKKANEGILRVVEAQYEHLPKFGVELASHPSEADIICNHGTALIEYGTIPQVNINHGLYWSRQPWGDDFMQVNQMAVESMRHAVAHTAPSQWVSNAIRRGGFWYPEVVYHGVDANKFVPLKKHEGFVLWNKARADYVSDPNDVMKIASMMNNRMFQTTIGYASHNLKILTTNNRPLPHAKMKEIVSQAGVYLATARETFGIGTLEAMAYGVPIAGWDWGGQSEIIIQGETGYLAPPGDWNALAECIELCFTHRDRLSANAVEDVRNRWKWEPRIEQYANIFKRVHAQHNNDNPKVSVIVTAYKLDEFLPECLDSIQRQTFKDFECLVVDDASLPSTKIIVSEYEKRDSRFSYHPTPNNFGLPGARNFGLSRSLGKYIRHVDADDFLANNALELEVTELDGNWGTDIAYGHLEVINTDGSRELKNGEPVRSGWPEEQFKWAWQMAHLNQLPSCVMVRRFVYERTGGYRERMKRNEDAEFWCRATSLGFRAKKFTQAVTYFHRQRDDSKGATEWATEGQEPDWTAWFPWRLGGHDYRSGIEVLKTKSESPRNVHLVPFGAQANPPTPLRFWYVHDHAYPVVSIVITVGPSHRQYLIDALDSIQAQTYPDWECIVVNDTGEQWGSDIMGAPWAKVVNLSGNSGTSRARNEGIKHINKNSKYVIWMDADDYWMPWFLEKMLGMAERNSGVIYTDLMQNFDDKKFSIYSYRTFNSEILPQHMQYPGSSVLIPKPIVEAMIEYQGGFDENIPGMEDWDYQIGIHHLGFCAYHLPEPNFVYRLYSSTKREADHAKIDAITEYLSRKYPQYWSGEKKIMCSCNTQKPLPSPSSLLSSSGAFSNPNVHVDTTQPNQMVVVEYTGEVKESFRIKSRVAKDVMYRFGNNHTHKIQTVFVGDLDFLLSQNNNGNPIFKVLSNIAVSEANDPASFIGNTITT